MQMFATSKQLFALLRIPFRDSYDIFNLDIFKPLRFMTFQIPKTNHQKTLEILRKKQPNDIRNSKEERTMFEKNIV